MNCLIGLLVVMLLSAELIQPPLALSQLDTLLIPEIEPFPRPRPPSRLPPRPPTHPDPREIRKYRFPLPVVDGLLAGCHPICLSDYCYLCTKKIPQQVAGWCWNATAQIVMDYHGEHQSQCNIAQSVYGPDRDTPCCTASGDPDPNPDPRSGTDCGIDRGGYPENAFDAYDFDYFPPLTSPEYWLLRWNDVKDELQNDRPYVALVYFPAIDEKHTVIVNGFYHSLLSSTNEVHIYDPQEHDAYWESYDVFYGGATHYSHFGDTYEIER